MIAARIFMGFIWICVTISFVTAQYISEFHYDNIGASTGEFLEVFFPDPQPEKPSEYKIYLYNGADSMHYEVRGLQGIQAGCDVEEGGCYYIWELSAGFIQDGPRDGIALVHETMTDTTVLEFISYEGILLALDDPVMGMTSTDIGVSEDNSTPVGWSLQKRKDGAWIAGPETKGYVNPIELLSFSGRFLEAEKGVLLEWRTASEMNNDFFEVQKSNDQRLFLPVSAISGAGNSQKILEYSYFDPDPYQGTMYYRLKQVDFGGHYSYSQLISIKSLLSDEFVNAVPIILRGGELYIKESGFRHAMDLSLYDNLGRLLLYRSQVHSGDVIQLNVRCEGMIFFHIHSQGQARSGPLLIIDH